MASVLRTLRPKPGGLAAGGRLRLARKYSPGEQPGSSRLVPNVREPVFPGQNGCVSEIASTDKFVCHFEGWAGADIPPMMCQVPLVLRQVCVMRMDSTSLLPSLLVHVSVTM